MERWRDIPGVVGYQASDLGRIRQGLEVKRAGLKKTPTMANPGDGYARVSLNSSDKLVHRLVWEAFNGRIPTRMTVNHKDGDKRNNRLSNLEVVTGSENGRHAWAMGLHDLQRKTPVEVVLQVKKLRPTMTSRELADKFGLNTHNIRDLTMGISGPKTPPANRRIEPEQYQEVRADYESSGLRETMRKWGICRSVVYKIARPGRAHGERVASYRHGRYCKPRTT